MSAATEPKWDVGRAHARSELGNVLAAIRFAAEKHSGLVEQPADWTLQRKLAYLDWAETVVGPCRGCNALLEKRFDVLAARREMLADVG